MIKWHVSPPATSNCNQFANKLITNNTGTTWLVSALSVRCAVECSGPSLETCDVVVQLLITVCCRCSGWCLIVGGMAFSSSSGLRAAASSSSTVVDDADMNTLSRSAASSTPRSETSAVSRSSRLEMVDSANDGCLGIERWAVMTLRTRPIVYTSHAILL